jgi:pimeloyl-ACP methyl ester carboxylesterase
VGAADEDAEIYRGIAERLADSSTVVTYDRRGTRRSGSRGWPSDSARHADDAAALISKLGLDHVTVFGASAGGIVALSLALRHPERLKTALCYEPGIFSATEEGEALRVRVESAVQELLRSHPRDWSGASVELGRAAASSIPETTSLFSTPLDKEWFALRTGANAESLIRGDVPLTREGWRSSWATRSWQHGLALSAVSGMRAAFGFLVTGGLYVVSQAGLVRKTCHRRVGGSVI